MSELQDRHLAAVMFTDLVGYTALLQDDESAALASRARHRESLEEIVPRHRGRLVQFFGDGSLSLFPSSVSAVSAALEIQQRLSATSPIPLRVGIDEGEVAYDRQGVYGHCVNRASRIEALAEPGSVFVSEKVHQEIENQSAFRTRFVGTFELKNVDRPADVYRVMDAAPTHRPVVLRLLGGASLERHGTPVSGRGAQRRRMAFLALLAAAPLGVLSRDKIVGYLWPDTDPQKARRLLSESLYVIRKTLGEDSVEAVGDDLRLNPDVVWNDVAGFREALERGELVEAVEVYAGPFLDGFYVDDAVEFERWVEGTRDALARDHVEALKILAQQAHDRADPSEAVGWWRHLIHIDPLDAAVALRYMQALEDAGRRAEALQFAERHARLLQDEFDARPNPEVEALAKRLRQSPATTRLGRAVSRPVTGPSAPTPEVPARPSELPARGSAPAGTTATAHAPGLAVGRGGGLRRRRVLQLAATVAGLTGVGVALQILAPTSPQRGSPAGSPQTRVAILPFGGSPEYAYLWEALSDYLAGGGNVTSLPNSMVAAAYDWPLRDPLLPRAADSVAAELGATHFTVGTAQVVASTIRFSLDLYEVGGREAVGRLSREGDVSRSIELLQQLALELLPLLSPNPALRLASATTRSPAALGAQNEGETAFLEARFDDAVQHFERAVQIDSAFGFGFYRLSQAYEWNEQYVEALNASERALSLSGPLPPRHQRYIRGWHDFLTGEPERAAATYENLLADFPSDPEALYGLIKVRLIYNPYLGLPRTAAKPHLDHLVSMAPSWGDIQLHRLEFAALEGDLQAFDSILTLVSRESKVARAWELARAMVGGAGQPLATLTRDIHEPEVFAYAVGQLDGFFGEPELADSLVEHFGARPEWAGSDWEVAALLYSGTFDLAQGQWRSGTEEIRRARTGNRAWAVEFEALYAGLPGRPDSAQAAREAHAALLAWRPSPEDESMMPFMTVHTGLNAHLREYLLGLTEIWLGDPRSATDNIDTLRRQSPATRPGRLAREFAASLAGHQAAALGDPGAALTWLRRVDLAPTVPELVASPFFARPHDRHLMARLYEESGDLEMAERWYRSLTDAWDFAYVAAGHLGLARVHLALGRTAQAEEHLRRASHRLAPAEGGADRLLESARRRSPRTRTTAMAAIPTTSLVSPGRISTSAAADITSRSHAARGRRP